MNGASDEIHGSSSSMSWFRRRISEAENELHEASEAVRKAHGGKKEGGSGGTDGVSDMPSVDLDGKTGVRNPKL